MYYEKKDVIFRDLNTSVKGLSSSEAKRRIKKYGYNKLKEEKKVSPFIIFLNQFKSVLIMILIGAVIISSYVGYHEFLREGGALVSHMFDPIVIFVIVILNAIMGFQSEYKAERSIEALKKLTSLKATVIRNSKEMQIDSSEVVPGDILVLATGDKIPADSYLIEAVTLETLESALTGESTPVTKDVCVVKKGTAVADRKNIVFSGTIITKGRGKAVVISTGMNTEIGKIAKLIQEEERPETPLQKDLKHLGKWLGILTGIITAIVFFAGILTGKEYIEMFLASISLAVAAIPEGLPAVVTIALALGITRLTKKKSLIRKLPSVETLGSTTVICTDKTGTLTHNEMTVEKLYVNGKVIEVTGAGYDTTGKFSEDPKNFLRILEIGALCNDAALKKDKVIGDPTEGALIVSAAKAKLVKESLDKKYPRVNEIPFDAKRKLMTTVHKKEGKFFAYTKGAPDELLKLCTKIEINGKIKKITKEDKNKILKINDRFARSALRVLGFAYKQSSGAKTTESDLVFVGLQGMIDPPRQEAKAAIEKCRKAGIKLIIVTGDHAVTATAIGHQLGIEGKTMTGQEIDKVKDLSKIVEDIAIFARVSPEHKLRIVKALKKRHHVIAMTGDGVNDAPALKRADIGIAMGKTGTDVAKEASEMILMDDNFTNIVAAIEEGRNIYENIKKFVYYLLSSNMGEILTIFVGIMLELPLPLIAIQILWINLVTDGFPALALGVEPGEPDIMERKPRDPKEKIVNKHRTFLMIIIGIIMMTGTLAMFWSYLGFKEVVYAQTIAFTTLMMFQMFNVINSR
ncbi:calcium-translocating P-type ATPase, PMCA-type, partial [Candidatus Woesearchaeota archaeon]|nr:calcium-translocating P-type ATPase, PMCA-type [Candidatus Woesearchaeota archaeon]